MAKIDPDEPCPCGSGKPFRDCHAPLVRSREPRISRHLSLEVVPAPPPGTASVLEVVGQDAVAVAGTDTEISYDCGKCSNPLMAGIRIEQVENIIIRCGACGSYNLSVVAGHGPPPSSPRKRRAQRGKRRRK